MLVRYITKATHYEEYFIEIPDKMKNKSKKELLKYIKKHDMGNGIYNETLDVVNRTFLKNTIAIEK